jgi:oxygen-independent coproporphyrinogen-3 oxidase
MDGTLRRNFQGFTDDIAESGIGFGASAISVFPDLIVQNAKNAGHYRMLASGGRLCASVGIRRSRHDRERAMIIEDILCGRPADLSLLIDAGEDLSALEPFLALGLAARSGALLLPTASSRPYARALAATFDPFRAAHAQRFSNAV